MDTLIRRFHQIKMAFILACCKICAVFSGERPWVLYERGSDARDNAYFFYCYLKRQYPNRKVYFIIDKNSPDYHKVKADAVHFGSLKNYWVIATAEKIISTHCYFGLPYMNQKLFRFFKLNRRFYFLQHGVTKDDIPHFRYDQTGVQLFVCGAKPEYDYIRESFGYPAGAVRYTGFARYDTLHDFKTKHQILIMPTWRRYITSEKELTASEYCRQWNQILQDRQLIEYLEKNDLTAVFYPHFEVQAYLHQFHAASARIIVADFAHFDVQTLLKESLLLITDYSSVSFDFAYMRKPVVYFQFDQNDFYAKHYSQGYFSYPQMGFGPVTDNKRDMVQAVVQSAEAGFTPTDEYLKRMESCFPLYDQKNCERIYEAICGQNYDSPYCPSKKPDDMKIAF